MIIPMMGVGQRFIDQSYDKPKFLLDVLGRPVLARIISMYDWAEEIHIFASLIHEELLRDFVREAQPSISAKLNIHFGQGHKLGPVWSLLLFKDAISSDVPIWINYADFGWVWPTDFDPEQGTREIDVLVPYYSGFHPHNNGTTNYAYLQMEATKITHIQEKRPFTTDKRNEPTSSGTYFFSSWATAIDLAVNLVESGETVNNEFFVSQLVDTAIRRGLVSQGLKIPFFFQWGTPEDYEFFTEQTDFLLQEEPERASFLVPDYIPIFYLAAGSGKRFTDANLTCAKYNLPLEDSNVLSACQMSFSEKPGTVVHGSNCEEMPVAVRGTNFFDVGNSSGQLFSAFVAIGACLDLHSLKGKSWLAIAPSDTVIRLLQPVSETLNKTRSAVAVVRGPNKKDLEASEQFGWITDSGKDLRVFLKTKPASMGNAQILTGAFFFRVDVFLKLGRHLLNHSHSSDETLVDNLFALCVDQALDVATLPSSSVSLGTPEEYWSAKYFLDSRRALKESWGLD